MVGHDGVGWEGYYRVQCPDDAAPPTLHHDGDSRGCARATTTVPRNFVSHGWNRSATDFPNYYTAAVLVRHGARLYEFYDWTWFQRQMSYVGFERQLGAYTPQTPLTMIPIVPLTQAPPQTAKRLWLAANTGFLAAALWMLAAMAGMPVEQIALLAFCGYGSLATNFGLGQYYVFLLFLMTLTVFLLRAGRSAAGGFLFGCYVRTQTIYWTPDSVLFGEAEMAGCCGDGCWFVSDAYRGSYHFWMGGCLDVFESGTAPKPRGRICGSLQSGQCYFRDAAPASVHEGAGTQPGAAGKLPPGCSLGCAHS